MIEGADNSTHKILKTTWKARVFYKPEKLVQKNVQTEMVMRETPQTGSKTDLFAGNMQLLLSPL